MRLIVALLSLSLTAGALAQESDAHQGQAGEITIQPVGPQPIPVPDGPAVHREERENGLIIEDIKLGEGYEIKPGNFIVAHYHGTLRADGSVFDSSFERGEPVAFPLTGVIQGWQQGVPGMKIGGVRRLTIPAVLAYGEQSPSPRIPANSDLVFVIQVVDALQFEDTQEGTGEAAEGQFVAVTAHVIRDAEGKEIERKTVQDPYIWLPGEFQGMTSALEGMKAGGKRKARIPAQMNQAHPMAQSERPQNVPLEVEIELIAVRNLNPRR
jgi:FKBP-type peptidyl-prolyl cis-trans isomerase